MICSTGTLEDNEAAGNEERFEERVQLGERGKSVQASTDQLELRLEC